MVSMYETEFKVADDYGKQEMIEYAMVYPG
jgi:hypothetical protein